MKKVTLIATATFGLEKVVKNEVIALGFENIKVTDGKVEFDADISEIPKANMWLRCADRVLLKIGEFNALTFDELFEKTKALNWSEWITEDGKFTVNGKAVKSTLGSIRACQSIVKKAVVENLKKAYKVDWFKETGAEYTILVSMLNDVATLTIDTSGAGLHKRGYRTEAVEAPLKETLAAAMILLSYWNDSRILIDPMCGSGTILIEAAMIGKNMAPGLKREFVSEKWTCMDEKWWRAERLNAYDSIKEDIELDITGYDIEEKSIKACKVNARNAGVDKDINFEVKDVKDVWIDKQYGIVITNPPYGMRIGEFKEINEIYISIHKMLKKKAGWSLYVLTADEMFPKYFKRAWPDRKRKLFNGKIEVTYYQYYGERPPKK